MERAARIYYSEAEGWTSFPGYKTQKLRLRGSTSPSLDRVIRAGVELTPGTGTPQLDASLVRFDRYLVAQGVSSPVSLTWKRERRSSHGRGLIIMVQDGSLTVTTAQRRMSLTASETAIVPPGTTSVVLESRQAIRGVLFSFEASEVSPLSLRWDKSDAGAIQESVRALLETAANAPHTPRPSESASLRGLLRAAARAVASQAPPTTREIDTLELVHLIVENRFQVSTFNVDDLARETGLSRRVLERRLRSADTTPAHVLRSRRVRNAQALIHQQPGLSMRDIALQSGFASLTTMKRALVLSATETHESSHADF